MIETTADPYARRAPVVGDLAEERRLRKLHLAAGFRIFAQRGFDQGIAGHVTVRDPELADHFWVNPFKMPFSLISVSDLLMVDRDGRIVDGDGKINPAAFAIHAAVHEAHPHLNAAAHSHTRNGRPWSAMGRLIDMTSQDACAFYESQVVFESFSGVVLSGSEGERIAAALARPTPSPTGHRVAILENHGILTAGLTVAEAVYWFVLFEDLCGDQLRLEATGSTFKIVPDAVAAASRAVIGTHYAGHVGGMTLIDEILAECTDLSG